jgi:hypothetical protein
VKRKRRKRFVSAERAERTIEKQADLDPQSVGMMEDVLADLSLDELREFLEADLIEAPVDPEFKERLREQLWAQLQEQLRLRGRDPH